MAVFTKMKGQETRSLYSVRYDHVHFETLISVHQAGSKAKSKGEAMVSDVSWEVNGSPSPHGSECGLRNS